MLEQENRKQLGGWMQEGDNYAVYEGAELLYVRRDT